jgi:PAS domain S-box-containing protein
MNLPKFLINSEFLEHLNVPIFVKSKNGKYVYCNTAFTKLIGKPLDEIINRTPSEILSGGLADAIKKQDRDLENLDNQNKDNPTQHNQSEIDLSIKKWVIYDINHDATGFIGAIHPISKNLKPVSNEYKKLTKRETEVLMLLAKGGSIKGIASSLGISPHTATDHIKSIYLKLNVHSKNEAIYKMLPLLASGELLYKSG